MTLNAQQFSAYDERPDPKKPGQQGVLFRKVAPAQDQRTRQHLAPEATLGQMAQSYSAKQRGANPVDLYNEESNWKDVRQLKGRATGMVPPGGVLTHGTAARLKPGSMIKPGQAPNFGTPGARLNDYGTTADVHRENAFAGTDLAGAHRFARIAQEMRNQRTGRTDARANVYNVQPVGPIQTDPEDSDAREGYADPDEPHAFQSKQGFKVLNKVQFGEHQEAYRELHEEEYGDEPGAYPWAPKTPQQRFEDRW